MFINYDLSHKTKDRFDIALDLKSIKYKLELWFGQSEEWESNRIYMHDSYGEKLCGLQWSKIGLRVMIMGIDTGPVRVIPEITEKPTLEKWRRFRNRFEVNPTMVMRKVIENHVDDSRLKKMDKSVKFWFKLLAVPAAFWALIYAPEIPRIVILFILSVFYMVYAYAEHSSAIEVRLFVIYSAYMFIVIGIPLGIIFGTWLYTIFFIFGSSLATNLWYYVSAMIVFSVSAALWLSLKGIPKQLTKRYWDYLTLSTSNNTKIDLSVRRASESLYDQSPLLLLLLVMTIFITQIQNIPNYIVNSIDQIIPFIATIGLLLLQGVFIYRKITAVDARYHTSGLAHGSKEYPEAVREVARELSDWNKQKLNLWK